MAGGFFAKVIGIPGGARGAVPLASACEAAFLSMASAASRFGARLIDFRRSSAIGLLRG